MWFVRCVLVLFCVQNVFALQKKYCKSLDNECLTNAMKERIYQKFVLGSAKVASSDPLHLDTIIADLPNLNYTLKHPTLIGMKNWKFLKVIHTKGGTVTYELLCPHLIIQSEYEVKGEIDAVRVEGKGNCEITYDNYYINIHGQYVKIKEDDGKIHLHIDTTTFCVQLELQAGVTFEYQNLCISGKENADVYTKKLEKQTRDIVMQAFLKKFILNIRDFCKEEPLEEIHFRYV